MQFTMFVCGCMRLCSSKHRSCLRRRNGLCGCVYVRRIHCVTAADISGLRKCLCPVHKSFILGSFKMLQCDLVTT